MAVFVVQKWIEGRLYFQQTGFNDTNVVGQGCNASTSIRKRAKKQTELTSHGRQHSAIVFTGRCLLLLTNKKEM